MAKDDNTIEIEGTIVDVLPNQMFKVELEKVVSFYRQNPSAELNGASTLVQAVEDNDDDENEDDDDVGDDKDPDVEQVIMSGASEHVTIHANSEHDHMRVDFTGLFSHHRQEL